MKKVFCLLWRTIRNWRSLVFIVYCTLILAADAFVSHDSIRYVFRSTFLIFVACVFLCPVILNRTKKLELKAPARAVSFLPQRMIPALFFVIPFALFLILFVIYYPGGLSVDTFAQYEETITGSYSDWHPVFHTLFAIKLPLLLTGGWIGAPTFFQIILFSAVLAYSFCTLHRYAGMRWTLLAMLYILLNHKVWVLAMYPWKDSSFSIGALLLTTYLARIYFTKGKWIKSPLRMAAFIATLAFTTLFRHNAILFTLPILLAVAFCISKKRSLVICLSFITLLVAVKGPLYTALEVKAPDSRQVEMLGLPMTVIGGVVANDPDALDEETREFAYAVAPQEDWEKYYVYGSYNSIKWEDNTNNAVIEEYGTNRVLSMMFRCFARSPKTATTSLIKLTAPVYTISDDYLQINSIRVYDNDFGVSGSGVPLLQTLIYKFQKGLALVFPHVFEYLGVLHLVLLLSVLAKCDLKRLNDWRKILFVAPIFIYNYGTTLLLTAFSDAPRFFNYTYLVFPILLMILFRKEGEVGTPPTECHEKGFDYRSGPCGPDRCL